MAERTQFGTWVKLESKGRGGQGEVFRARKINPPSQVNLSWLADAVRDSGEYKSIADRQQGAERLVSLIRQIATEVSDGEHAQIGALKVLHETVDEQAAEKAAARMSAEVEALRKLDHPSLVHIYEANTSERWFVMEYFNRGTLLDVLGRTQSDVLGSLLAFRPLVEAVSELHKRELVHRDIKPANVFVGDDGRLVLGDFGLVIDVGASRSRVTDIYENVGSRDWMPGWAYGKRLDQVMPNFDVFSLAKLLWSLVSGKPFLRLWYFQQDEFNVEKLFPENPTMRWATRLFKRCIVEHEADCKINDASELLREVDQSIDALKCGGQVLRKTDGLDLRCRICGLGNYRVNIPDAGETMVLHCEGCGCEYRFAGVKLRPAWE
jgi:serine/threonine protein kinase